MPASVQAQSSTSLRLFRTCSQLFSTWASMAPGLSLNFPSTFLIFGVSSARVSKVLVKSIPAYRISMKKTYIRSLN
jgi:hypothetical protein